MTKKRIIYQLNIENGQVKNSFSSSEIKDKTNPIEISKYLENQGADELLFWDNSTTNENREEFLKLLKEISENIKIPFAVKSDILSVEEAQTVFNTGVNKIILDSKVMENPELVDDLSLKYGEQAVAVSIYSQRTEGGNFVYTHQGTQKTDKRTEAWITQLEQLGAGEIFLTSLNSEKSNFDISIAKYVSHAVSLPVILSVKEENLENLKEIFEKTTVSGIFTEDISVQNEIKKLVK